VKVTDEAGQADQTQDANAVDAILVVEVPDRVVEHVKDEASLPTFVKPLLVRAHMQGCGPVFGGALPNYREPRCFDQANVDLDDINVDRCYDTIEPGHPRVRVDIVVHNTGAIASTVFAQRPAARAEACIRAELHKIKVPPFQNTGDVTLTLELP
jgi:hypothetical protein